MLQTSFTLNNNVDIPSIGLGTWQAKDNIVYDAVTLALKAGYRHIDTAFGYGNEVAIGQAIRDSDVARSEIFVTTKMAPIDSLNPAIALEKSLKNLDLEYVDLYLMHWPIALNSNNKSHPLLPTLANGKRDILLDRHFVSTYVEMQPLIISGKARAIGVSNMSIKNLKLLLASNDVTVKPAVNQVELHPYLPQHELLAYSKQENIILEAYSPLGSIDSPLLQDENLKNMASSYGTTVASILISWAVWRGTVALPKSANPSRIMSNFQLVRLKESDGLHINNLSKTVGTKRFINPDWDPIVVFND
ncbi:hypothetical protein OXX59_007253 [Metschnikowia pulcherrima]